MEKHRGGFDATQLAVAKRQADRKAGSARFGSARSSVAPFHVDEDTPSAKHYYRKSREVASVFSEGAAEGMVTSYPKPHTRWYD